MTAYRRNLYAVPAHDLGSMYKFTENRENHRVRVLKDATLVSSDLDTLRTPEIDVSGLDHVDLTLARLTNEATNGRALHAPALDVDGLSALTLEGETSTLWLDLPITRRVYRRLLKKMTVLGLTAQEEPSWRELNRNARRERYAAERHHARDDRAFWETTVALAGEFEGSFEELLEVASTFVEPTLTTAPVMSNPWPFPLLVPAHLAPSTTPGHHHLYLDVVLEWPEYRALLQLMEKAKVIETGYLGASLERTGTYLRRPGVKKPPPPDPDDPF